MENCVRIRLKDNQSFEKAYAFVENDDCSEKEIPEQYWDGIKEICDINKLISQYKIVSIPSRNRFKNKEICERVNDKLYTYNWIGVVSNRTNDGVNYRVEIHSRFDGGEKQYFLLYLLSTVCGMNIFDININSEEESDYTCILILLFLYKLLEAYGDGLYKEYIRKEYNDYGFKGIMDINKHIKYNNPFIGKTAYSTKEYSYDNEILCLLRQTIDYIVDYYPKLWDGYLCGNTMINEVIEVLETATPSYKMNENYSEMIKCRKEITHPMFKNYDEVRKIALMILHESGQNFFDNSDEESFGILIDISWLWEEFIAVKLLDGKQYIHMLTDRSRGSLQWAEGEYWYPDFIEKCDEKDRRNVFDAKYKYWNWSKDSDVHQLLSYLFLTGGEVCGVIYPSENEVQEFQCKQLNSFNSFYDGTAKLYELPLYIPQSEDIECLVYYERIEDSISDWKKLFEALI